ncbi:hypothetical protein [Enterococcus sp. DIV2324]|uniref:hypothetical protein n=1 Tax=Enterococcus sp. DIV2324 TaxID=2774763 RepID=UPI003F1FB80A
METFVVYDIHEDGKHRGGKRIVGTVENLAAYIYRIEDSHRCIVTDTGDNFLLNTIGNMIDHCGDRSLLNQLLPLLIPYQMGSVDESDVSEVIYK